MKTLTVISMALVLTCAAGAGSGKYYLLRTLSGGAGGGHASSPVYDAFASSGQTSSGSSGEGGYSSVGGFWSEFGSLTDFFNSTLMVDEGWNLVSVPWIVADGGTGALMPTAVGKVYSFGDGYHPVDSLVNGKGYWAKFGGDQFVTIVGGPLISDTIDIAAGWNLIGTISDQVAVGEVIEVPEGILLTVISGFSNGYYTAATLDPGHGYWVKASSPGKIVLASPTPPGAAPKTAAVLPPDLHELTVSVEWSAGRRPFSQKLYFGSGTPPVDPAMYEMPPPPPAGATDVRFGTNRFVNYFTPDRDGKSEVPLAVSAPAGKVSVSWKLNTGDGGLFVLVGILGEKTILEQELEGEGKIVLDQPADTRYLIRSVEVPKVYALDQNYPNPFNPTTRIRFQLPQDGPVTLRVYNLLGQEVVTLAEGLTEAGYHTVEWNASSVATGVYYYRLEAPGFSQVKKMMLVK